jgi:hypothetical protein
MEYQTYLLRLQRSQDSDQWRATLQNAYTGEVHRFANEREMLRYLLQALAIGPTGSGRQTGPGDSHEGDDPGDPR